MSDALALYNPADYDLSGATADELSKQLALIGRRRRKVHADDESSLESESEDEDALLPPGPVDAENCLVTGAGASGGAAGAVATFKVVCKDSNNRRVVEGGASVLASITAKSLGAKEAGEEVAVLVKDNGDGSYSGMYTVSARGNYELVVTIDGTPTGGSPYPVFFSPPETAENLEGGPLATVDQTAAALGDVSGAATGNSLAATAQEVARMLQPDLARISAASDAAAAAMVAQANSMGPAAVHEGVHLTRDEKKQLRSLLVANISKALKVEQMEKLFGFCGKVKRVRIEGSARNWAIVEYTKEEEAAAALAMQGMTVMGTQLRVELVRSAVNASSQGRPEAPFAIMHAHQVAQLQMVQSQQDILAAQVAQMRAAAKLGQTAAPPVVANNSQSQKAAALAAAAALSKRLAGTAGATSSMQDPDRDRGRSRSPHGGGQHKRGPRPYSPPRKRPSGRARSLTPRSRAARLQRTDNREREAMRAKEAAAVPRRRSPSPPRRRRSHSRRHSPSPPPKRSRYRSRSRDRMDRDRASNSHRDRRDGDDSSLRRRDRSPIPRDRSPIRRHRSPIFRNRSPVPRDRSRDRKSARHSRSPRRSSRSRSPRRRSRSPSAGPRSRCRDGERDADVRDAAKHQDHGVTGASAAAAEDAATEEAAEAVSLVDPAEAALAAALAAADAAAAAEADAARAPGSTEVHRSADAATAQEAAELHANGGQSEGTRAAVIEPGGDEAGRRKHRKYRRRDGSRSLSPAGQEHRSKKKRHHEKGDREGEKKHKHKHKKRHDRKLRDASDEEREADGMKDQDEEEKELRQLALSALDTPAPHAANTDSDPPAPDAP